MQDVSPAVRLKQLDAERSQIIEDAKAAAIAAIEELNALGTGKYRLVSETEPQKPKRAKTSLPPKYVHNGNTWSGKGRPPPWLKDLIDAGHAKDEFLNPERR